MPEYTLTYDAEVDNHTDDEGRTIEEILDDGEIKTNVRYVGDEERVETKFVEEEEDEEEEVEEEEGEEEEETEEEPDEEEEGEEDEEKFECREEEDCTEAFTTERGRSLHETQSH